MTAYVQNTNLSQNPKNPKQLTMWAKFYTRFFKTLSINSGKIWISLRNLTPVCYLNMENIFYLPVRFYNISQNLPNNLCNTNKK